MKCKACGGNLRFYNGNYLCENCGLQQTISAIFENTEIFLCYIENDIQGRRSRDSVIAQDLYNKLENAQIHTFYQRISTSELTKIDFETVNSIAFDSAKIVVVIAATAENFQTLIEKYGEKFAAKSVIPVYANMNANDIPKELKHLQAVNYNAVGSSIDFVKNVSRILGKDQEITITAMAKNHMSGKKRTVIVSFCVILSLALFAVAYVVFGTPYVLKSKKYEYASYLLNQKDYSAAISLYSALDDYADAPNIVKQIYEQYNGYFTNSENTLSLHLNIFDNKNVTVEVARNMDGSIIKFSTSCILDGMKATFEYEDSFYNKGSGTIELCNNGIEFHIQTEQAANSIGSVDYLFLFENRIDAPISISVDKTDIIKWVTETTTENDLVQQGLELEFVGNHDLEGKWLYYRIKNSDIGLLFVENDIGERVVKECYATQELLFPDKSLEKMRPVVEENILYMPDYLFGSFSAFSETDMQEPLYRIESKSKMSMEDWNTQVEKIEAFNTYDLRTGMKYYVVREDGNSLPAELSFIEAFESLEKAIEKADMLQLEVNEPNIHYAVYDEASNLIYRVWKR